MDSDRRNRIYDKTEYRALLSCDSRRTRSFELVGINDTNRFDDKLNQNVYKSQRSAHIPIIVPAPEVVLEIPSDSDSSRRPSHCSLTPSEYSPFVSASPSMTKFKQSSLTLDIPQQSRVTRRASHCGELLSPNQQFLGSLLNVPNHKERKSSLPSTIETEELYRLRNFSIQGKRVLNRGDSIRSRRGSKTSMSSRGSRYVNVKMRILI